MSKPVPALFDQSPSDEPYFFSPKSMPRRSSPAQLTYRYDSGTIAFSKGLLDMMEILEKCDVGFVIIKKATYIYRAKGLSGFWVNTTAKAKSGVCSGTIFSKPLVRNAMRSLGHGAGEIITFPVAPHPVSADELGLDPSVYTYPFYRIVTDQKSLRE